MSEALAVPTISAGGADGRRRLFAFERNAVVRAGAGTGKTEALATVYLHLVGGLASPDVWPRAGVGPERIVALTFTEKAAREMRERIAGAVALLSAARLPADLSDPDAEARRSAALRWGALRGVSPAVVARVLALADSALRHGRPLPTPEHWQRVAWSLGAAQIGTFHSFASKVLRRAAVELDLDPGFTVLEEDDSERLLRAASLEALARFAQRDVGAVVELMAAAGGLGERDDHGLVNVVSSLVRRVEEDGVRADTLGVSAAADPADVRTYVAADVLARFAEACDAVPSLRADGTSARMVELARAVEQMPVATTPREALDRMRALQALPKLPARNRTKRFEDLAEEARESLSGLTADAVTVVSRHLGEVARAVLAAAQRGYELAKRKRNALDYADLMRVLRDALRDRPSLRRQWKARYDALLVDEFQDTNRVQRDLLYLLRERRDAERALAPGQSLGASELEPQGLLVVGDAKQSIYAFRGAEVSVFIDVEREVEAAGGERVDLTDSFRAVDGVLDVVNDVTRAVLAPGAVTVEGLYEPERDALVPMARGDGSTRVEVLLVPEGRADEHRKAEAEAIAERIHAMAAGGAERPGWRAPRMDEIAVLVPSWSHLEAIKRALQARNIPYALRGGPGFWERREVDDLVTLLRFVASPSDRLSLAALLRGPLVGLSDAGLARLFMGGAGYESALDPSPAVRAGLSDADRDRLDEARPTLRRLVRFGPSLGPHGVLRQAVAERGYAAVLARLPFGAQRVANVDKLVGLAAAAEQRGGDEADLLGFVQYVDRVRAAAKRESEADLEEAASGSVTVMSIHAAKGLEWPVVFVAQTSRRRPPRTERVVLDARGRLVVMPGGVETQRRFHELRREAFAPEDDDQRRLLYVALTRARDLLVVSGPDGNGEGEWNLLRGALLRDGPFRVRVTHAADVSATPPVTVRARRDDEGAERDEAAVPEAPTPPRRRLAIAAPALQDLAWCRRRFHALHDLGLREHGGAGGDHGDALALARAALTALPLDRVVSAPEASVARLRAAGVGASGAASIDLAAAMLKRYAKTALAESLAAHPEWVLGRAVPWALSLPASGVTVTGEIDLLLSGEALDREGFVVVKLCAFGEGEEPETRGGVTAVDANLELTLACRALRQRLADEGGAGATVAGVMLGMGDEGAARLTFPAAPEDALVDARVEELSAALARAHATGTWDPRPRWTCESLRCGLIPRCHG
ncbi:MAG: UvrD-helicase domain-containing protein [Polyangiales bacterium]